MVSHCQSLAIMIKSFPAMTSTFYHYLSHVNVETDFLENNFVFFNHSRKSWLWEHWRTGRGHFWRKVIQVFPELCWDKIKHNIVYVTSVPLSFQWGEHSTRPGRPRRSYVPQGPAAPHHARLPSSGLWSSSPALQTLQPEAGGPHGLQTSTSYHSLKANLWLAF